MIKTKGKYELSLNGGKDWVEVSNMLVKGYYALAADDSVWVGIGSNGNIPTYSDTSLPNIVVGYTSQGLNNINLEIKEGYYHVSCYTDFDLGTGHEFIAKDIGMAFRTSGNLASRALFKDSEGNPININVSRKDVIKVRYTLTYIIPRTPIPVTISVNGVEHTGTLRVVNPNKWGDHYVSRPIYIQAVGIAPQGTWTTNQNGYIDNTGSPLASENCIVRELTSNSNKIFSFSASLGVDKFNHTFGQIAFSNGGLSTNNIAVLIDLDTDIVNTPNDYLALGVEIVQEYVYDSQQS